MQPEVNVSQGHVHCPMCTHTVSAIVECTRKSMEIQLGQKCPRCQASLDAAAVLYLPHAA